MEEVFDDFIGKFYTNDRLVELDRLAQEQGWGFTKRMRFAEQTTDIKNFRLFKGKRGKRVLGVMDLGISATGCATRIYDYIYYSDGGKKKTTVVEVYSPDIYLTKFRVHPRKGLKSLFARRSNHGDALDQFNKHYLIETADPAATDIEVPDRVLMLMMADKDFHLEGEGHYLIYYKKAKQLQVNEILTAYDIASQIAEAVLYDREKDYV